MSLKTFAKALVRSVGFDLVRYAEDRQRPFPVLPLVVERFLRAGEPFTFVQVGANDGVLDDPIRACIVRHKLAGVLVEPLPDLFDKLKANYAGDSRLVFENLAIMRSESHLVLHRVKADASVPFHWHGIASFEKKNLLAQGVPPSFIETTEVPGISMAQLLTKHRLSELELLQVDTEGYDLEVIKSTFEAGVLPAIVNYENCWLPPRLRSECKALLDSRGYSFLDVGKDTLAVRRDKLELLQV